MRDNHPQQLDQLLNNTTFLKSIQQHAVTIAKLNNTVKGLLPAPLHPYCRVANYRHHILILETANANWLMRLRYEQSNLLTVLRTTILPSLVSITIKVNPSLSGITEQSQAIDTTINQRYLSTKSAEYLTQLAEHCPDGLSEKLKRLAALAKKKP